MATTFQQLQMRLGTGIAIKSSPAGSYKDFEADVIKTSQRPYVYSMEDAMTAAKAYYAAKREKNAAKQKSTDKYLYQMRNQARYQFFMDAMDARVGFGDRMYLFWSDHFVTRSTHAAHHGVFAHYQDTIRKNMTGTFYDLLCSVILHPTMLMFLNQDRSCGPNSVQAKKDKSMGLNENLGRELLELHTLGSNAKYTQTDVRQTALLLTGLRYSTYRKGGIYLDDDFEEPGTKTILGKKYDKSSKRTFNHVKSLLAFLAMHPSTIDYVCRKLAIHFTNDTPDNSLVSAMKSEWVRTKGNLMKIYIVMVSHPAILKSKNKKVKRPVEFVISGLRAIGCTKKDLQNIGLEKFGNRVMSGMKAMGQDLYNVDGPNGWPEQASSWITPGTYAPRINWATNCPAEVMGKNLPKPNVSVDKALAGTGSSDLSLAVTRAPSLRDSIAVLLASNEFNRR